MPGEKELLGEFVEQQFVTGERPAFAFLLEMIFDRMTLAGEAGSLLRIDEEIRTIIADAKRLWKEGPKPEQVSLFSEPGDKDGQGEMRLDLSGITDEQFWERAEQRIYDALEAYAEQTENGGGFQRRLFADDAAQGFAFIDICRNCYDVVVMNPPFGEASDQILPLLKEFESFSDNIAAPFAERFLARSTYVAMVVDRALLIRKTHENFRRLFLERGARRLHGFSNYGWGVLDANVEVAALVAADANADMTYLLSKSNDSENLSWLPTTGFAALPNLVISGDVPEFVANAFAFNRSLGESIAAARVGHQWKSERYLRLWWEGVDLGPFVYNGAPFSPYVFVTRNRLLCDPLSSEVKSEVSTAIRNSNYHYQPGVGYGKRGIHLDAHPLPAAHTFTVEGLACFPATESERFALLAYLNSLPVSALLSYYCGQHKHVGYVNCLPYSSQWQLKPHTVEFLKSYIDNKRTLLASDETSPLFVTVSNEVVRGSGIQASITNFKRSLEELNEQFDELHASVGQEVCGWLRFPDGWELARSLKDIVEAVPNAEPTDVFDESGVESAAAYTGRIVGELTGCIFGRWDIRYARGDMPRPELPDPFAPLPICPPGMLQGDDGLPLSAEAGRRLNAEGLYPLDVAWDGILVDDVEHPLDVERRVRAAFAALWGDRADALENEACGLLGVPTLREWFRRPTGFFADHLKRYSKSRRKAPIYWPLSTASGSYTVWIYYHRLTTDTLFQVVVDFLDPKLLKTREERLHIDAEQGRAQGREAAKLAKQLGELASLEQELDDMRGELLRVAELPYKPDLNDGMQITAAPLWKLFQLPAWRKVLEATWKKLEQGEYDWAHVAYAIWPDRVREKCKTDRSMAIAHGLEDVCEVKAGSNKKRRKKKGA